MNKEHKAANQPVVHEVREDNEENWKCMVESKLIKVTLRPNEKMDKCPAKVFTELDEVIDFNLRGELWILGEIIVDIFRTSSSSEPSGEVTGVSDKKVAGQRCKSVVEDWKGPLD